MPCPSPRRRYLRPTLSVILALAGVVLPGGPAALAAGMHLVDFGKLGVESQLSVNGPTEVAIQIVEDPRGKSLEVRCTPGTNPSPGVIIRPGAALNWNLSAYGEVEADVTNLSDAPLVIQLRVASPGEGHEAKGSAEKLTLPVGKAGTVRVYLGAAADALDAAKIKEVVLFTSSPAKGSATFRVTALRAAGKPGDKPTGGGSADTTTKPGPDGAVLRFDGSLSAAQAEAHGMRFVLPPASKPGPALITVEPGANPQPSVVFKVAPGTRLDLSGYDQVGFALKNTYALSVHVFCRVENAPDAEGKPIAALAEATLEPGASKTVTVSLAAVNGGFARDKVTAFSIAAEQDGKEKKLELTNIKATSGDRPASTPTPTPEPKASPPPPDASPTKPAPPSKPAPSPGASPKKPNNPGGTQKA